MEVNSLRLARSCMAHKVGGMVLLLRRVGKDLSPWASRLTLYADFPTWAARKRAAARKNLGVPSFGSRSVKQPLVSDYWRGLICWRRRRRGVVIPDAYDFAIQANFDPRLAIFL